MVSSNLARRQSRTGERAKDVGSRKRTKRRIVRGVRIYGKFIIADAVRIAGVLRIPILIAHVPNECPAMSGQGECKSGESNRTKKQQQLVDENGG